MHTHTHTHTHTHRHTHYLKGRTFCWKNFCWKCFCGWDLKSFLVHTLLFLPHQLPTPCFQFLCTPLPPSPNLCDQEKFPSSFTYLDPYPPAPLLKFVTPLPSAHAIRSANFIRLGRVCIKSRLVSSAKTIDESNKFDAFFRSFTHSKSSSSPSTEPCGTAHVILSSCVFFSLSVWINCFLFDK